MTTKERIRKTDETRIVRLDDIPFYGDFVLLNADNNNSVMFDSREDGGDVPPLLILVPVIGIEIKNNLFYFTVSENLYPRGV